MAQEGPRRDSRGLQKGFQEGFKRGLGTNLAESSLQDPPGTPRDPPGTLPGPSRTPPESDVDTYSGQRFCDQFSPTSRTLGSRSR